ncbi:helix-turn-helix domain-containing protein [Chryseobacterium chendengshani]|uniref:helix-turn-helix transcriptional regulator n=1 Tax=Chryseobacterium sp. LJ668 TaxID=2864040 RepID=UPI001C68A02F|nr:helix-turn-helix transcriptional regulator [Chryseobacterium sp. LJ668]MBW8522228.1 helix-turn-helix domain-containing protein [Chryseobacterium sp. LJ668]QYK17871.1 helix-turn-helix domain-containing protein [Chryseobacterium sp. LJ668]
MKKEKLIIARKAKKISQNDIAIYLKISQTQYQKRESGKIKMTDLEWQRISKLLDVEVDEIYEDHIDINVISLKEELKILKEKIKILEQKLA